MKSKFIMTAMATLLAFQVAVADEVQVSQSKQSLQNKISASQVDKNKTKKLNVYRGPKATVHAKVDVQFVFPGNRDAYKTSMGENYLDRGYDSKKVLVTKASDVYKVIKDYDGGLSGNYSKKTYYNAYASFGITLEQMIAENMSAGASIDIATLALNNSIATDHDSYVFFKSPYFTVNAGYVAGAEQTLKLHTKDFSAAGGGVSGSWTEYANLEGSVSTATSSPNALHRGVSRPFHATPKLYSQYNGARAARVSIYSNDIYGMKIGASYAPNYTKDNGHQYDSIVAFGASYKKEIGNFALHLAAAGEMGKAVAEKTGSASVASYHDLFALSAGGAIKYHNMITVGGEYGHLGKSGLDKQIVTDPTVDQAVKSSVTPDNSHYWVLMAAYDMGPARVSVNYYNSYVNPYSTNAKTDGSTLSDLNVGVSYDITHACRKTKLTPYLSYHQFNTSEKHFVTNESDNNSGYVVMTGVKAQF